MTCDTIYTTPRSVVDRKPRFTMPEIDFIVNLSTSALLIATTSMMLWLWYLSSLAPDRQFGVVLYTNSIGEWGIEVGMFIAIIGLGVYAFLRQLMLFDRYIP